MPSTAYRKDGSITGITRTNNALGKRSRPVDYVTNYAGVLGGGRGVPIFVVLYMEWPCFNQEEIGA